MDPDRDHTELGSDDEVDCVNLDAGDDQHELELDHDNLSEWSMISDTQLRQNESVHNPTQPWAHLHHSQ